MLDLRASEDQGMDLAIRSGSFDTKIPLNINEADIDPESKQIPAERHGVTDLSFTRITAGMTDVMRQMTARAAGDGAASLEDQSRLLNEIYQKFDQEYFQHTPDSENIAYWVAVSIARLVMSKMTLIVFLPVLFSSPSDHISDEIRIKLLIAAIEVAEYNHMLNAEQRCRQWRWVYQTHTHWHATVYLLIEISRRPWSPIVERAWVAVHSRWLMPVGTSIDKNLRIWVPLRKLMANARKHRNAELSRLRQDPQAAARLETEDQTIPLPSSSGPFPNGSSVDIFRERWRQLVAVPEALGDGTQWLGIPDAELANPSMHTIHSFEPNARSTPVYDPGDLGSNMTFEPTYLGTSGQHQHQQDSQATNIREPGSLTMETHSVWDPAQTHEPSYNHSGFPTFPADWADTRTMGPGFMPWLWADTDPSVDVFSNMDAGTINADMDLSATETNWYSWVESAQGMEWNTTT